MCNIFFDFDFGFELQTIEETKKKYYVVVVIFYSSFK